MPKTSLSSLELAALVQELQFLIRGKVSQIYHQEKKELLLQLHAPGRGKQLLKVIPGKFLCLTEKKETALKPSSFSMQLRKYLDNASIKSIYQKDTERIVVMELEKNSFFYLIMEFFSKGNVVLADLDYNIIGVLEQQEWKDRSLRVGRKYLFPKPAVNWKKISLKELSALLKKSEKKNLATFLATEIGLGGLYAEEVCKRAGIDKGKLPGEVASSEAEDIIKQIKDLTLQLEKPQGLIYGEEITPLPLMEREPLAQKETYNEAIDTLNPFPVISPYEKKIQALQRMVAEQEEAVKKQEEKAELNTRKGELIYEKYTPLNRLLEIVRELRKGEGWGKIAEELKKEKKIRRIDLKEKKVVIDL